MRRFVFLFIMLSICTSLYSQNLKELQRKVNSLVLQGWYQLALDEIEKDWGSIDILQNDSEELFIIAFYKSYCLIALSDYDSADTFITKLSNQIITWEPSKQRNEYLASLDYLKGILYLSMNNFSGANRLLMSSKSYFDYESRFGNAYVNVLFTLANVKLALGQKLMAKLYIDEANDILSKSPKASSLGVFCITLAKLYNEIGKREDAISLLESELQNLTPDVAQNTILQIKIALAYFYAQEKKYQQAFDLISNIEYGDNLILYELKASLSYLLKKGNVSQYIQDYNSKMMKQSYSLASHFADIEFEDYWASLSKKKKILISPTLNLNKVNFGAISCGAKRLGDVYQLASISTLNSLFQRDCVKDSAKKSIALFGGIDYDVSISVNKKNVQGTSKTKLDRSGFDYLPETLNEVTDISVLLTGVMNTTVYSGQKATESQFKLLSRHSPSVIHISTHGFYLKGKGLKAPFFKNLSLSSKITYKMSKCGLLFSGANNAWNGIYAQDVEEDCILTAAEVEKMDLSDTELVVLSACDTGLGDCESIDGVYGLSRAFKIAGAHTIVMTLWKVNDLVTKEFMCEFYGQIKEGLEYHEAFRIAQKRLRLKYQDPLLWAPFVIID